MRINSFELCGQTTAGTEIFSYWMVTAFAIYHCCFLDLLVSFYNGSLYSNHSSQSIRAIHKSNSPGTPSIKNEMNTPSGTVHSPSPPAGAGFYPSTFRLSSSELIFASASAFFLRSISITSGFAPLTNFSLSSFLFTEARNPF